MVWGASMALGTEAFRRFDDKDKAIPIAITATQYMMESFFKRAKSIDCGDITETDFGNKWSFAKYMFTGKFYGCFKLADKWAPEAIESAKEGLLKQFELKQSPISCASEVVKKMDGSHEETVMVAGFAGGLGLSGNACGALAAAIWKTILELIKKDEWKPGFKDPVSEKIIERFYEATDYKMECHEICGMRFKTLDEHTEYIKNGGCDSLINVLAQS